MRALIFIIILAGVIVLSTSIGIACSGGHVDSVAPHHWRAVAVAGKLDLPVVVLIGPVDGHRRRAANSPAVGASEPGPIGRVRAGDGRTTQRTKQGQFTAGHPNSFAKGRYACQTL